MQEIRVQFVRLGPGEVTEAVNWVSQYYAEDHLQFDSRVEAGVSVLLDHPEWGSFWRIELDGVSCGYIVLTFGFDHEVGGRIGTITDFYINSSCRGQGVGAKALDLLLGEAEAMGLNEIGLVVLDHNERVRPLYQRAGFRAETGRAWMCRSL